MKMLIDLPTPYTPNKTHCKDCLLNLYQHVDGPNICARWDGLDETGKRLPECLAAEADAKALEDKAAKGKGE